MGVTGLLSGITGLATGIGGLAAEVKGWVAGVRGLDAGHTGVVVSARVLPGVVVGAGTSVGVRAMWAWRGRD